MNDLEFTIGCLEKEIDSLEGLLQLKYQILHTLLKLKLEQLPHPAVVPQLQEEKLENGSDNSGLNNRSNGEQNQRTETK